MNPAHIKNANVAMGAPPSWDAAKSGECCTLPVLDAGDCYQSAWYPTPQELKQLIEGKPIILTIWSRAHPPVSLTVATEHDAARAMFCPHGLPDPMDCPECLAVLARARIISGNPS